MQVRASQEQLTARWMATLRGPLALLALMLGGLLFFGRLASRNESLQLQAQAQQRTSEQQLANIVEHAAEGIVTFGMDGVVRRYNRAAESILHTLAEMLDWANTWSDQRLADRKWSPVRGKVKP